MIFPDISLEKWLTRYPDLKVVSTNCFSCGNKLSSNTPFLSKDYVGVTSVSCVCGDTKTGCRSISTRTIEEHNSWIHYVSLS